MKARWMLFLLLCAGVLNAAAEQTSEKTKAKEEGVTMCRSLDELKQAKARGDLFINIGSEFSSSYYVRIGSDYKGPFQSLATAKKVLEEYRKKAKETGVNLDNYQGKDVVYNPGLVIFPFVELAPEKKVLFTVPEGKTVDSSKVMIHPEPLVFNGIKFGRIVLGQQGPYFAVTGQASSRAIVSLPTDSLKFWVGAAVIGAKGSTLWKSYGSADSDLGFKCIDKIAPTTDKPEFLLVFMLAEGKLKEMIRPSKAIPEMNASPYDYHVLCSAALDVGPDWFPPIRNEVMDEYQNELKKYEDAEVDKKLKSLKKQ